MGHDVSAEEAAQKLAQWLPDALSSDSRRRTRFVDKHFSTKTVGSAMMVHYRDALK
jgi:hypothetical protein